MCAKHALCIVVDGLRASALGAYGNTVSTTPEFDALAAQSVVCDWMWCETPQLQDFYGAVWRGQSKVRVAAAVAGDWLPTELQRAGIATTVLSDDPACAEFLPADAPCEIELVAGPPPTTSAPGIEDTAFYRLLATAAAEIEGAAASGDLNAKSHLWWVHAKGFAGGWDAPLERRAALLDEEDETPLPEFVQAPISLETDDPEELLGYRVAYAAQAGVLDECLGGLLAAIDEAQLADDLLVTIVGARGFALGEHGRVGAGVDALYGERLQIPCLVRRPGTTGPVRREQDFLQPPWLHSVLREWFDLAGPRAAVSDSTPERWAAARGKDCEFCIRTPHWLLRQGPRSAADEATGPGPACELYAKPDDRWEANEISALCPDAVAELLAIADKLGLNRRLP